MVNWQMFKVTGSKTWESDEHARRDCPYPGAPRSLLTISHDIKRFDLDKYVEFSDGYKKSIMVKGSWGMEAYQCGGYASAASARNAEYENFIEIDIDRTRLKRGDYYFENEVIKIIPEEVVVRRKMESVASADPNTLAIAREAMDRVDRGQNTEFKYESVDNSGIRHYWTYYRK